MPDLAGTRVGPYDIVSRVGAGGMGEVFKAHDGRLNRTVAIKRLSSDVAASPDRVQRFEREARAASALNHPNILTIHDIVATETGQFIVSEFVEGETLRQRIMRGPLDLPSALDITIQVARALVAAHASGIVHRDIKPENIMVRPDGLVKLLDFGVAKLSDGFGPYGASQETTTTLRTGVGAVMGTARYMSPEQARGVSVDGRSDIFSLGVVLYEMAAGTPPFRGATFTDVLVALLQADPPPLSDYLPSVPPVLQRIVTRALRKDSDERYQVVKDLLIDLREVQRDLEARREVVPAGETAPRQSGAPDSRSVRRGSRAAVRWILLTLASAVLGAAILAWYRLTPEREPPSAAMRVIPFTSFPHRELHPSFSPDGSQIAFAWEGETRDSLDIYVKLVGEGRPLHLTSDPRPEFSPAWSPDGRYLAFYRHDAAGGQIVLVPALGGAERVLKHSSDSWRPAAYAGTEQRILSWFPDGDALAVIGRTSADAPAAVSRLSIETGVLTPITRPRDRTWGDITAAVSPNGQSIAFVRSEVSYWVKPYLYWAVLPNASEPPRRVSSDPFDLQGFAWMPDSRRLVFPTNEGLRLVAVADGTSELLPLAGYVFSYPVVSAGARRMAFTQASWDLDIWRLPGPASPGNRAEAASVVSSTRPDTNPQYSPDGTRVVFSSTRGGPVMQIWICDSEGANLVQITNYARGAGTPRWSPDGRLIAFDSVEAGTGDIYVAPTDGGPVRRIATDRSHEQRPSWSRDGRWIYFESDRAGRFELWKTPLDGGSDMQVTDAGGADAFESPDGQFVYYAKDRQHGIWRRPVSGGSEAFVTNRGTPNMWGMYEGGLCTLDANGARGPTVECLSFADSRWSTVARLPSRTRINQSGPSFSVSHDGRWILYVQREREESDVMLVENFR